MSNTINTPAKNELEEARVLHEANQRERLKLLEAALAAAEAYEEVSQRSATDATAVIEARELRIARENAQGAVRESEAASKRSGTLVARAQALVELERLGLRVSEAHVPDEAAFKASLEKKAAEVDAIIHPLITRAREHDTTVRTLAHQLDRARKDSGKPLPEGVSVNGESIFIQREEGLSIYGPRYELAVTWVIGDSVQRFKSEQARKTREEGRAALEAQEGMGRDQEETELELQIALDGLQARQNATPRVKPVS